MGFLPPIETNLVRLSGDTDTANFIEIGKIEDIEAEVNPPLRTNGLRVRICDLDSASLTLTSAHELIAVNYSSTGSVALSLPSATAVFDNDHGATYIIADTGFNAALNNITCTASGSDKIIVAGTGANETAVVLQINGGVFRITAISKTKWMVY